MARLYADEDFDRHVVVQLRALGHDVLTVQEAGRRGLPDEVVLADATSQGRAVLTFNRDDFKRLHRLTEKHCGVIVCTRDADASALAMRVHNEILTAGGPLECRLLRVCRPAR